MARSKQGWMRAQVAAAAVAALALAVAGFALATPAASGVQVAVTLLDGKLVVSPKSLTAGQVTLLVVNRGTKSHALAIFRSGTTPKRTATLAAGARAKLVLQLSPGAYRAWDPVGGSLGKAIVLTVRAAATTTAKASSGGSTSGSDSVTRPASGGSLSNNGTTTCVAGQDPAMVDTNAINAC